MARCRQYFCRLFCILGLRVEDWRENALYKGEQMYYNIGTTKGGKDTNRLRGSYLKKRGAEHEFD